jgi:diaminopimelate epimerase
MQKRVGKMDFTKMQGIGNDFVLIDATSSMPSNPQQLAKAMCERHFGIGADGVIFALPSEKAPLKMRIFNPDGSEAEMCGNGIRCLALFAKEQGLIPAKAKEIEIETKAGILSVSFEADGITVDMGEPILKRKLIPISGEGEAAIGETLEVNGHSFVFTAVSMGNPHCVIFVDNLAEIEVEKWGPLISNHPLFPNRTNVEFVEVRDEGHLKMLVWERGAGRTLACGTGACASTVAAVINKKTKREVSVSLEGGELKIKWNEEDNHIYLTGPAEKVFYGKWLK